MFRQGMLNTMGNAVQRAAVLVLYILAARETDPTAFGMASSLVALAITIGSLSSLSLGHTANRTLSRLRTDRLRGQMAILIAQVSLLISLVSTGLFLLFSKSLIRFVSGGSVAHTDTATIALAIFAISFGSGLKGHIWADMRYSALLASSVLSATALFAGYMLFLILGWPLPLLQAYTAMVLTEAAALSVAVGLPLARSQGLMRAPNWRLMRPVLQFAGLATLNGLIFTPVNILLIAMINHSLGSDVGGRFNLLVQIRNAIVFLPNGFASVILTLMSRERQPTNLWRNSLMLGGMAGAVSVPICIIAYLWRPEGMQTDYIGMLALTAMTSIVIALNTNIGQAFLALGRLWFAIAANVIWSVTTLGLVAIVLALAFGGFELVLVAILLSYVLHTGVQIVLIRRTTRRAS